MLDLANIEHVDKFSEKLRDRLQVIGRNGEWGAVFELSKAAGSDYYRAPVIIVGKAIKKNWLQLNGSTYFHPSYSSPKPWKIQARFEYHLPPNSHLWEKKIPYVYNRQPLEWSIGGTDVWAIPYEKLAEALSSESEDDVLDQILGDLRVSHAYANGHQILQDSDDSIQSTGRVNVMLSVDAEVWSKFEQVYSHRYRSRKKHPKRPSYASLRDDAIDTALRDYVTKCKRVG